jgi:16S rRNA processing protein RimM
MLLRLEGIDDPDAARALTGSRVYLPRREFPAPAEGEFYFTDLVGLRVRVAEGGEPLGIVEEILSTPAFDLLVVRGGGDGEERLVPFTRAALREVRLGEGEILVGPPETWEEREGSTSRGDARRGREHARPRRGEGPKGA